MKKLKLAVVAQFVVILLMSSAAIPARAGSVEDSDAALAAAKTGRYDEAIQLFTRALNYGDLTEAGQAQDLFNRGLAYAHRGDDAGNKADYDRAISDFTRAGELNPAIANFAIAERDKAYARKSAKPAVNDDGPF
jgi:tetratricopeptide (TPR) repeat protein